MIEPIKFEGNRLLLLDQRKLPETEEYLSLDTYEEIAKAIKEMVVRGAPAIGITAAFGFAIGYKNIVEKGEDIDRGIDQVLKTLKNTRPTAYNLFWALDRMEKLYATLKNRSPEEVFEALIEESKKILEEDISTNQKIGEYGSKLIADGFNILTHCNTGSLATGGFGTALGVITKAHLDGKKIHVFVDETRPRLQGARLTVWELEKLKIPYTLITDNMAGFLMSQGRVDIVITGADRVARNGDTANKIGTYSLAVLCDYHNIPFYIACPFSTIDPNIKDKSMIPIEERDPEEVRRVGECYLTVKGASVLNPSFDITPGELIKGFITEKGVKTPPFDE